MKIRDQHFIDRNVDIFGSIRDVNCPGSGKVGVAYRLHDQPSPRIIVMLIVEVCDDVHGEVGMVRKRHRNGLSE